VSDLVTALQDWRVVVVVMALFGTAPGVVLRLLVHLYPEGHERRRELLNELYAVPYVERPWFVAQQLETTLFEGLGERRRTRKAARRRGEVAHPRPLSDADPSLADAFHRYLALLRQPPQTVFVFDHPPFGSASPLPEGLAREFGWPRFEIDLATGPTGAERVLRRIARVRRQGKGVVVRLDEAHLAFAEEVRRDAGIGAGGAVFVFIDRSRPGQGMARSGYSHPGCDPGSFGP
jgi:hypothetical protein